MVMSQSKPIVDTQGALVERNRRFQLTGFEFEIA